MAYDGVFIKAELGEIKNLVLNEHIAKITETSFREVNFHIRKNGKDYVLSLNANPNFPYMLLDLCDVNNMKVPPAFCMLLRKYLQGSLVKDIYQVGIGSDENNFCDVGSFERIVKFDFQNIDENGDVKDFHLFFEIMGKYSNIIVTDENYIILDTLIRNNVEDERLKQKNRYSISEIATKREIASESCEGFLKVIKNEMAISSINEEKFDITNAVCKNYAGISKPYALSVLIELKKSKKSDLKSEMDDEGSFFNYGSLSKSLNDDCDYEKYFELLKDALRCELRPCINYKSNKPADFYLYKLNQYEGEIKEFETLNSLIKTFVDEKYSNLSNSSDKTSLDDAVKKLYIRINKKIDIYKKDLDKCKDLEKYKKYGELVAAFGYDKSLINDGILTCCDYMNNDEKVSIPIDESISISQNVEKYYDKYNKLKRTKENAQKLIEEAIAKLEHLNSIASSISLTNDKNDLFLIKEELVNYFDETRTINSLNNQSKAIKKRESIKSQNKKLMYNIHHYKSSSGIDIYVGKNNLQNEYLTWTVADASDTWLHIKDATGSHVIVKKPYDKLDDKTLIEAASLAAYFSDKKNETKATVDYTLRKELKKVKGKAPGFCIYHKNYSINVKPEILIKEV